VPIGLVEKLTSVLKLLATSFSPI